MNVPKIVHQRANQRVLSGDIAEVLEPETPASQALSGIDQSKRFTKVIRQENLNKTDQEFCRNFKSIKNFCQMNLSRV